MRVITTTGTRNFGVVLRDLGVADLYDVVIYNESTKVTNTITLTRTNQQIIDNMDLFDVEVTEDYNEGAELSFYIVENGSTEILHRNKIFVTDKIPQNYSK